jgi:hypothetical protein
MDATADIAGPQYLMDKGVWAWDVRSPYLSGSNAVEVLLPANYDPARSYRVLYVLPVHPGIGGPWGDGLQEARKLGVHDQHDLICVSPAFDGWPYYGTHAAEPRIRHEEYILKVLLPLVESSYSTLETCSGRMLLGFSKSGWGSMALIFRHPEVFGYAVSWDAPLMMTERNFGLYETAGHFGTPESMARYAPVNCARMNANLFRDRTRLAILGHNFFGTRWLHDLPHTWRFHRLLGRLGIRHVYDNQIKVPHTWNPEWMRPAVDILMQLASNDTQTRRAIPRTDLKTMEEPARDRD